MPDETHVTGADMRVTVTCGDRSYQLRPITFGEAAELAQAEAGHFQGGASWQLEVIREALRETLGDAAQPHLDAIDAFEEADVQLGGVALGRPHPQEPAEAFAAWRADMQRVQTDMLRAASRRVRAEALVADHPKVAAVRQAAESALQARRLRLLCLSLGVTEAEAQALPAAHAEAILAQAEAMRRPGVTEGKA